MTLTDLAQLAAEGGIMGAVIWAMVWLHRSAVAAEQRRADDWRSVAKLASDRADERDRQLISLLSAVREVGAA
jgi:hypothetical protein